MDTEEKSRILNQVRCQPGPAERTEMPCEHRTLKGRLANETSLVRVMLADGRPEVRSALRLLVEQHGGMTILAEAAEPGELLCQARIACPDVLLLDCDLPGIRVKDFLHRLRSFCPRVRVVAMSSRPEMRQAAVSGGADDFVCKTDPPEKLLAVLRSCVELTMMEVMDDQTTDCDQVGPNNYVEEAKWGVTT
jgi:CheY-like chemotaxis protein